MFFHYRICSLIAFQEQVSYALDIRISITEVQVLGFDRHVQRLEHHAPLQSIYLY